MTQLNFTLNFEELKEQITTSGLDDVTKSMLTLLLNDYMKQERDEYMGNKPYDRSAQRYDYRNGLRS